MTSLGKLRKRKSSNIDEDLLTAYKEQYKLYFENSINKCSYKDKYDDTINGECILLDVSTLNPKNNGDEKYITTLPDSNIKIGMVLSIEFAKDVTEYWVVVDKENLAIPSHDKFKLSPVYWSGELKKCDGTTFTLDVRMDNNNSKTYIKYLYFSSLMNVETGDLWYCDNGDTYIITEVERNLQLPFASAYKCNQTVMLETWQEPKPCYVTSNSYGSKGEVFNNDYISDMDARAVIYVQIDEQTKRDIVEGTRFIFNHSKYDIYEITKKTSAYHSLNDIGYYDLVCKYVKNVQEDNFDSNIAYNYYLRKQLEDDNTDNDIIINIIGEDKINLNVSNTETYNVINLPQGVQVKFVLDDDTLAENIATIVSSNSTSCTVQVLKPKMFQIECRDISTNELLSCKTVYGVRR